MVRVLTADIATTTGFAHDGPTDGVPICTTFRAMTYGDDFGIAYKAFRQHLVGLVSVVRPDVFCFEAPLTLARPDPGGGDARMAVKTHQNTIRLLFGLAAVAEMCAAEAGVECFEVRVQTWKRQFTGNGRATKSDVMARCRQLGWSFRNNNESDAAGMWCVTKSIRDPAWAPKATPLFRSTAP